MIDIDLRKQLIEDADVLAILPNAADPRIVQQNKIDQGAGGTTRIWYARSDDERALGVGGEDLLTTTTFDLECMSDSISTAEALAEAVRDALHGFKGILGSATRTLLIKVGVQGEEYKQRNSSADDGLHVVNLAVEIIST